MPHSGVAAGHAGTQRQRQPARHEAARVKTGGKGRQELNRPRIREPAEPRQPFRFTGTTSTSGSRHTSARLRSSSPSRRTSPTSRYCAGTKKGGG